jgi:hypothetical protein
MYNPTECGIKLFARPTRDFEPDLLAGHEADDLVVKGPGGDVIFRASPSASWTHDSIVQALNQPDVIRVVDGDVADAYLGERWIGSTEI